MFDGNPPSTHDPETGVKLSETRTEGSTPGININASVDVIDLGKGNFRMIPWWAAVLVGLGAVGSAFCIMLGMGIMINAQKPKVVRPVDPKMN